MLQKLLDERGLLIALAGLVLYIIGFVVVNVHLISYGATEPSFLRARHAAAAVLFLAVTAVPFTIGLLFRREYSSIPEARRFDRVWISLTVTLIVGFVTWVGIMNILLVDPTYENIRSESLYFLAVLFSGILLGFSAARGWPNSLDGLHLYDFSRVIIWLVLLVGAVMWFSTHLYPRFRPGLGGGAAWLARVYVEESTFPSHIVPLLTSPVRIVDRSNSVLRVLACDGKRERSLELNSDEIRALETLRVVSMHEPCDR